MVGEDLCLPLVDSPCQPAEFGNIHFFDPAVEPVETPVGLPQTVGCRRLATAPYHPGGGVRPEIGAFLLFRRAFWVSYQVGELWAQWT